MKPRLVLGLFALAVVTDCASKTAPPLKQEAALTSSKSLNWNVELVSVTDKKEERRFAPARGAISLKVRIEYLGPTGAVTAPVVAIGYSQETVEETTKTVTFLLGFATEGSQADPEKMKVLSWLVANQPMKTATASARETQSSVHFEHGKKFDGILAFGYALNATTFKLSFGDVEPIPFEVRRE